MDDLVNPKAKIGHNGGPPLDEAPVAADRLRNVVERIERLDEERKALGSDIRDMYAEAKGAGFDVKVLRQLIALRRKDAEEVEEQEQVLGVYKHALGM